MKKEVITGQHSPVQKLKMINKGCSNHRIVNSNWNYNC
jgi:hypothetical protein